MKTDVLQKVPHKIPHFINSLCHSTHFYYGSLLFGMLRSYQHHILCAWGETVLSSNQTEIETVILLCLSIKPHIPSFLMNGFTLIFA